MEHPSCVRCVVFEAAWGQATERQARRGMARRHSGGHEREERRQAAQGGPGSVWSAIPSLSSVRLPPLPSLCLSVRCCFLWVFLLLPTAGWPLLASAVAAAASRPSLAQDNEQKMGGARRYPFPKSVPKATHARRGAGRLFWLVLLGAVCWGWPVAVALCCGWLMVPCLACAMWVCRWVWTPYGGWWRPCTPLTVPAPAARCSAARRASIFCGLSVAHSRVCLVLLVL
jgi:hypothetical protein